MEPIPKILVIDDEPDVVSYLSAALEDEGYQVIAASDGSQGLQLAQGETPDLITLDITMPGMSGVEVLTALRRDEHVSHIPVIIVTGVTSFENLMDYRDIRPPEGFLPKPVDLRKLFSIIENLLRAAGCKDGT